MTTGTTTGTTTENKPARPRRKKQRKPQGQWAVDGREPLNDDERVKQEDPGISVMQRIRDIYSKEGFDSIPAEDLAPRFKWVGMYTQRKQGLDGEKTSTLTNAELQDNYFMMRILSLIHI